MKSPGDQTRNGRFGRRAATAATAARRRSEPRPRASTQEHVDRRREPGRLAPRRRGRAGSPNRADGERTSTRESPGPPRRSTPAMTFCRQMTALPTTLAATSDCQATCACRTSTSTRPTSSARYTGRISARPSATNEQDEPEGSGREEHDLRHRDRLRVRAGGGEQRAARDPVHVRQRGVGQHDSRTREGRTESRPARTRSRVPHRVRHGTTARATARRVWRCPIG